MISNQKSAVLGAAFALLAGAAFAAPGDTIRVNSGGPQLTDPNGNVWAADSGFTGGATYEDFNQTVTGTIPALHNDERYGDAEDFGYNFNVNPGTYTINLYNATLWDGGCGVGTRIFDVTVNGVKVVTNYDMNAEVACLTEHIKSIPNIATVDGKINITFNVGAAQNPKINAIEIVRTGTVGIMQGSKSNLNRFAVTASNGGLLVTSQVEGAYSLSLMDIKGKVLDQKSGLGIGSQSFSNLRPGLYLLNVTSGNESVTRKVNVVR